MHIHRLVVGCIGLAALSFTHVVFAIGNFSPTPQELQMLPAYCAARAQPWGNDPNNPEVAKWLKLLGQDYITLHHYCDGLLHMMRADRVLSDSAKRGNHYRIALDNFEYLETHIHEGFVLGPEIVLNKGRLLMLMGKSADAIQTFERAIQMRPDYAAPYVALADHYLDTGNKAKAREIVEAGLKHVPDSKTLLKRQAALK